MQPDGAENRKAHLEKYVLVNSSPATGCRMSVEIGSMHAGSVTKMMKELRCVDEVRTMYVPACIYSTSAYLAMQSRTIILWLW